MIGLAKIIERGDRAPPPDMFQAEIAGDTHQIPRGFRNIGRIRPHPDHPLPQLLRQILRDVQVSHDLQAVHPQPPVVVIEQLDECSVISQKESSEGLCLARWALPDISRCDQPCIPEG